MKRILFNRITFFVLFALTAAILMGTTVARPVGSDLHQTAGTLINESSNLLNDDAGTAAALQNPGAILRANVIE